MKNILQTKTTHSLQAPIILGAITFLVLTIHVISPESFGGIDLYTFLLAIAYLIVFTISFYLINIVKKPESLYIRKKETIYLVTKKTRLIFLCTLLITIGFFLIYNDNNNIISSSLEERRSNIITISKAGDYDILLFIRAATITFFFSLLLYLLDTKYKWLYLTCIMLIPFIMTSRNLLVIFFIFYIYKTIYLEKNHKKSLIIIAVFILMNSFYVWAFNKSTNDEGLLISTLKSMISYLVLPLHGFFYHIEHPSYYGDFLTIPSSLVSALGYNVERDFIYTPAPFTTNVYTLFFSIHYDFGIAGVIVFAIFSGLIHGTLYYFAKSNTTYLYIYLFSLYPLIMSYFDNVYTTAPGIWLYIILPLLFFKRIIIK